jgi:hypothetical protein
MGLIKVVNKARGKVNKVRKKLGASPLPEVRSPFKRKKKKSASSSMPVRKKARGRARRPA